jgi:hypothetical protein
LKKKCPKIAVKSLKVNFQIILGMRAILTNDSIFHSTQHYCPLMQYELCRNWKILTVVSINYAGGIEMGKEILNNQNIPAKKY